jgi:hypothetical protein
MLHGVTWPHADDAASTNILGHRYQYVHRQLHPNFVDVANDRLSVKLR